MWEIQVQLWLHLADHYLRHKNVTDADAAVMEAVSLGHGLACGPQVSLFFLSIFSTDLVTP